MGSNAVWDLKKARLVLSGIIMSVLGLWIAGFLVAANSADGIGEIGFSQGTAIGLWAALAFPALAVALYFRGSPMPFPIVSWALLEAPALLTGIFFLVYGNPIFPLAGAAVFIPGILATFPRSEDFPDA